MLSLNCVLKQRYDGFHFSRPRKRSREEPRWLAGSPSHAPLDRSKCTAWCCPSSSFSKCIASSWPETHPQLSHHTHKKKPFPSSHSTFPFSVFPRSHLFSFLRCIPDIFNTIAPIQPHEIEICLAKVFENKHEVKVTISALKQFLSCGESNRFYCFLFVSFLFVDHQLKLLSLQCMNYDYC